MISTPAPVAPPDTGKFAWLPVSRSKRVVLYLVASALTALTFAAYLRPNMVFDLANMIFCA